MDNHRGIDGGVWMTMQDDIESPCDFVKDWAGSRCPYCVQALPGYESDYVCTRVMVWPHYRYHGQRPCFKDEAKGCPLIKGIK